MELRDTQSHSTGLGFQVKEVEPKPGVNLAI